MTPPKTLSPAEALRALADGKKLTCKVWESGFVHLSNENIRYQDDGIYEGDFAGFYEYTEPRPKRKVAPYIVRSSEEVWVTSKFYETDAACLGHMASGVKIVRRVTELEVEVED